MKNVKRILVTISLLVCSAIFMAACAAKPQGDVAPTPKYSVAPVEQGTASPTATPEATPKQSDEVAKRLGKMMPILDSICRSMGVDGQVAYAPRDGEFFWSTLYLACENWGVGGKDIVPREDGVIVVDRKALQELAGAAFFDYDDLLPIPESYKESLKYDEGQDAYEIAPSDMDENISKLDSYTIEADNNITAIVGLYGIEDTKLGEITFTLTDNPYASGITEPTYYYSVTNATCAVG